MVSVIIPVYNTKQYLQNCLDSILAQTYTDLEILFIDDGSTDGSGELLDLFAEQDSRVRVLHKMNGGVSSARNRGLDEARGEYITFVDSDDLLEPDMYETLMGLIRTYDVDIAHCSYNRITDGVVKPIGNSGALYRQDRETALRCFLTGKLFIGSCWNKLYAAKLFENVRFDEDIKMSEDLLVNFQVFSRAEFTVFLDVCKYNYVTSDTSSCIRTPKLRRSLDNLTVNRKMLAENTCSQLDTVLKKRILNALFACYKASVYAEKPDREFQREMVEHINAMHRRGYSLSVRTRVEFFLLRYLPPLYKFAYGIYDRIRVPNYDVESNE